jgi:DNA repair exonuclease SbcCD ATPase subunit
MRYGVADVNRIRDGLSVIRQEAQKLREQRQQRSGEQRPAPPGPSSRPPWVREPDHRMQPVVARDQQAAGPVDQLATERAALEASRAEFEQARLKLEQTLAEAELSADQARVSRDRAWAELEAAKAELQQANNDLEAARAAERATPDADTTKSARRGKKLRAEKRIAELEGELETERELRQDFELAFELLQRQQAEDGGAATAANDHPNQVAPPPEPEDEQLAEPEPGDATPVEPAPDGWGVPLDAFPVDAEDSEGAGKGSGAGARAGRRPRLRPGRRSDQ